MEHTKGHWRIGQGSAPIYGSNGELIDEALYIMSEDSSQPICRVGGLRNPHTEANARLIAAAPELLAAVKAANAFFENGNLLTRQQSMDLKRKLMRAITKAMGE
jgi:hypothetical protein